MHKEVSNHDKTKVECAQVTYSLNNFLWKLCKKKILHFIKKQHLLDSNVVFFFLFLWRKHTSKYKMSDTDQKTA